MTFLKRLPDESVDFCMTSPPYWGLRDYSTAESSLFALDDEAGARLWVAERKAYYEKNYPHVQYSTKVELSPKKDCFIASALFTTDKGIGLEHTFHKYIDNVLVITEELKRVLKKTGSFYLNIGDTYAGGGGGNYGNGLSTIHEGLHLTNIRNRPEFLEANKIQSKSLYFIPERLAIRMEDEQKWVPRNKIIWHKPNGMPNSVKDRLTNTWEYIFHFAKSQKYCYNLDAIRVPHLNDPNQMEYRRRLWASRGHNTTMQFSKQGRYQGKFIGSTSAESFGSPRARTQRNSFNVRVRDLGKNRVKGPQLKVHGDCSEFEKHDDQGRKYEDTGQIYGEDKGARGRTRQHLDDRNKTADESFKGANTMRQAPEPGSPNAFHTKGKNPGDVITERNLSMLDFFGSKGSGGHYAYGGLASKEGKHMSANGKNPGDIINESPEVRSKEALLGMHRRDISELRKQGAGTIHWGDSHPSKDPSWYNKKGKNPGDFWKIVTQSFKGAHFAVFPLGICWNPILSSCPPDGVVLDIFGGSGTVAEAVELTNIFGRMPSRDEVKAFRKSPAVPMHKSFSRRWMLCDINPGYVEIAKKRLSPYGDFEIVPEHL